MKKLCFLLFLPLFGISNLDAQNSNQRDSTNLPRTTIQRDSSHLWHDEQRDSTRLPNSTMQRDSSKLSNTMQRDNSRLRSDAQRDSLQPRSAVQRDSSNLYKSNMDKDQTKGSNSNMSGDNRKNDDKRTTLGKDQTMYDVSLWPEASRTAADEITAKYGKPDEATSDELIWKNKGPWKKICVSKMETQHNFPLEHTDMMATTINYKVPYRKMDDLGRFDGSITFDRTQGTMTARCDKEANNFLALNLANDIVTGKKSVLRARTEFENVIREKMNGGSPEYMEKLTFSPNFDTGDPGINTMGLTKADVTKAAMANKSDK